MLAATLTAVGVLGLGQTKLFDLWRDLEEAMDAREPALRMEKARRLAARKDVSIEEWSETIGYVRASLPLVNCGDQVPPADESKRLPVWQTVSRGTETHHEALLVEGETRPAELWVHLPHTWNPEPPAPLLLVFHGTGGNGSDVESMWHAAAESLGMLVLAPTDSGPNEGYTYSVREREEALAALRWMRRRYEVDPDRIYATGISRGGHLAWDLALRHPDLFAAIAPMIGGPRFQLDHGQNNLRFLENVVSLPIRDLQGARDDPALVANVRTAFKRLDKLGARDAKLFEFPELGHSFDFGAVDWKQFFGSAKRDPIPDRVVLLASKVDGARAFWVEITKLAKEVSEDVVPTVTSSTWKGLDENGRRDLLETEVEKRTARLEVKRSGPNRFTATGERVLGFRLLLAPSMFDPAKPVQILFGGKLVEKKVVPDAKILLGEFVERFDKSFLPVAAVDVP